MDKYSVLMSLYKKEQPHHFKLAIDSMINQTIPPNEIVLVEDGPLTEELYAIIEEYISHYPDLFQIVINDTNLGLGVSLNRGLLVCQNELVARMDTDDISKPDRCEKQLNYFRLNPYTSILGGQIEEFIDTPDNIIGKRIVPENDPAIKEYMTRRCPFNHMTVMFRKSHVLSVGNYQDWFWNEDYYLWIRLALNAFQFANLPNTLVTVRVGVDMYQRRGGLKYFKSEEKIQRLMLTKSLITFPRYIANVTIRFVLQVVMPNRLRGIVFKKFARS